MKTEKFHPNSDELSLSLFLNWKNPEINFGYEWFFYSNTRTRVSRQWKVASNAARRNVYSINSRFEYVSERGLLFYPKARKKLVRIFLRISKHVSSVYSSCNFRELASEPRTDTQYLKAARKFFSQYFRRILASNFFRKDTQIRIFHNRLHFACSCIISHVKLRK